MANVGKKITELDNLASIDDADVFVVHHIGDDETKHIEWGDLKALLESVEWGDVGGNIADQPDLQSALDGKANSSHNHVEANITDLDKYTQAEVDSALSGKSDTGHNHTESDITDLDKYTQAEVDASLGGKSDTGHNHVVADITDFDSGADARITTQKGSANGLATLGADSKIPTSQLPALAISETFVVDSEVNQLALTVQEGDIAVRTDENKSYIALNSDNADMGDWQELLTPTDAVLSVNGFTGAVSLDSGDISEGSNLYFTQARARQSISETITGIDYDNSTGVFSITSGYGIPTTSKQSDWDDAFGWGNHASEGYLTEESDTLQSITDRGATTTNGLQGSTLIMGGIGYGAGDLRVKASAGSDWFSVASGIVRFNGGGGNTQAGTRDLGARFNINPVNDTSPALAISWNSGDENDYLKISSPNTTGGDVFMVDEDRNTVIGGATGSAKLNVLGTDTSNNVVDIKAPSGHTADILSITAGSGVEVMKIDDLGNVDFDTAENLNATEWRFRNQFGGVGSQTGWIEVWAENQNGFRGCTRVGTPLFNMGYDSNAGASGWGYGTSAKAEVVNSSQNVYSGYQNAKEWLGQFTIKPRYGSTRGLVLKQYSGSYTANIFEYRDTSDNVLTKITSSGAVDSVEHLKAGTYIGSDEMSADPSDPANGSWVMWQSDGTDSGDDGDVMMKITDSSGTTKTATLVDFSAV